MADDSYPRQPLHPSVRGCVIAPEKSFRGVLSAQQFSDVRHRLKQLRLYAWLTYDGGWNEYDTREFYSYLKLVDGHDDVLEWTCLGASFSFTEKDISAAIGVPTCRKSLEEVTAKLCSVDLSHRLMGYDATERLDVRRGPMHAAIFARAAQTNLIPVLNPKMAMRRHSLLLLSAVDSDSQDVGFNIPRAIFREMWKVANKLHWGKVLHVLGYPYTILRLLALHGFPIREADRYIQCYSISALYPHDTPVVLKKSKYAQQHKMEEEDQKIEEVLGEVRSMKQVVSNIQRKIECSSVRSSDVSNKESHINNIPDNHPSPVRAKTGPYPPGPEDVVADIVQKKLLADCILVEVWPHLCLSSRDLFCIVGDNWTGWISNTIIDSYIGYMRHTIAISPTLVICTSHIVSHLVQVFGGREKRDSEKLVIDLDSDEPAAVVSTGKSKKGKKGRATSRKRRCNKEDDVGLTGLIPELRKKCKIVLPLAETENILVPICDGSHWFLLQIFGKEGYGWLLNSDIHCKLGENIALLIERWWRVDSLHEGLNPKKFSLLIPTDIPHQDNPHDCGVFVLKFIECIMSGREFEFTGRDVTDFRRTMFRNLLNYPGGKMPWKSW